MRNGAVFATARKLATLIYRLLRWGQPYMDEGVEAYEKRYRQLLSFDFQTRNWAKLAKGSPAGPDSPGIASAVVHR